MLTKVKGKCVQPSRVGERVLRVHLVVMEREAPFVFIVAQVIHAEEISPAREKVLDTWEFRRALGDGQVLHSI